MLAGLTKLATAIRNNSVTKFNDSEDWNEKEVNFPSNLNHFLTLFWKTGHLDI